MVQHPLLNKRIVVTRAEEQSESIISLLKQTRATVIAAPTIRIVPAGLSPEDELRIFSFYEYDVVVFPSANSVRNFFPKLVVDRQQRTKPYIIAIGKKTAEAISEFGFAADFIPGKFTTDDLMKSLSGFEWKAKRVLIPVGNLSSDEIAEFIESNGAVADEVVVYETLPNDLIDETTKFEIGSGQFDIIIFYSPSQVRNFVGIFGVEILKNKQIAVIGPTTRKAVEHYGLDVAVMPDDSTTEDLIKSLLEHEKA